MRTLYSFSLLCLFLLGFSSSIAAFDEPGDMFWFPNDSESYADSSTSEPISDSNDRFWPLSYASIHPMHVP